MRCVLAQIKINKVHKMLAQITRDNFFLWKDKDKKEVCVDTNHNKQLNNHRKTSESILTTSQLLSQCNNFTVPSILTCKTLPKEINDCNNHRKTKHKWQEHNTRWYSDSEFKVTSAWMGRYVTED